MKNGAADSAPFFFGASRGAIAQDAGRGYSLASERAMRAPSIWRTALAGLVEADRFRGDPRVNSTAKKLCGRETRSCHARNENGPDVCMREYYVKSIVRRVPRGTGCFLRREMTVLDVFRTFDAEGRPGGLAAPCGASPECRADGGAERGRIRGWPHGGGCRHPPRHRQVHRGFPAPHFG